MLNENQSDSPKSRFTVPELVTKIEAESKFQSRVYQARNYLENAGLVETVRYGAVKISDWGKQALLSSKELIGKGHIIKRGASSEIKKSDVSESVLKVLREDYSKGFKFDTTAVRLLSEKIGFEVDVDLQNKLKHIMFKRKDGIHFLPDSVVSSEIINEINDLASASLDEYGYFEVQKLYATFRDNFDAKSIRSVDDFETFYNFITKNDVKFSANNGIRIARARGIGKTSQDLYSDTASKIIIAIVDEFMGTIYEDELNGRFTMFSTALLSHIINLYAPELVKTEINGITSYQTFDALGLPDNFSDILDETLLLLDTIGLIPSDTVLHTALSIKLGLNFNYEYNIRDNATYKRVISKFYKGAPKREWSCSEFAEVRD